MGLIMQLISSTLSAIAYCLQLQRIWRYIVFCIKKAILYVVFLTIALIIILISYHKQIPIMSQTVHLQFHLINGYYYAFAFDPDYKTYICQQDKDAISFLFQTSTLNFQKNLLCGVIIHEKQNEVMFQEEYYQVWFRIQAQFMDPHHITSVLDVNTYLLQENQAHNIKQKNIIKLGEYYYFKMLNFFPVRILFKIYDKIIEFLDASDTYMKSADFLLFTHIPNVESKLKVIIIQIQTQNPTQLNALLEFTPELSGLRYFLHFYFWTTLFIGSLAGTATIIVFWEIILNTQLWIIVIKLIKDIIQVFIEN